ncbi:TetR/AcrR family transcriptional regulator [Streptomyces sp. TRM66268-LWL]|uniref:TetR/AcrR family transcriptional regulator n=1 Tax=Streptomyces polyasparticus TaxID=2767826 RepID=A0ABR7SBY5_9ACTN|nr:TetR/AcrR family transcriptional regulator [Streptomyces polyasparticus]MBC9712487.1 TetR/AcrR family transcriptional regulator [Streptomyces polyasparticus]
MSPRKAAALPDGGNLRDHLIATAERIIAERGTVGLTVRAIAREAGVADGVLYNHFAAKEELLAQALNAHVRKVESGLGVLPAPGTGSVEENLKAYVAYGLAMHQAILPAFTGFLAQPKILARFAELAEPGEDWRDRLAAYLRAELDLGRLPSDAKTSTAARILVGYCHEVVISALFDAHAPAPDPAAVDDLVAVVLRGIAS